MVHIDGETPKRSDIYNNRWEVEDWCLIFIEDHKNGVRYMNRGWKAMKIAYDTGR